VQSSGHPFVAGYGQEVGILVRDGDFQEQRLGVVIVGRLARQGGDHLVDQSVHQVGGDHLVRVGQFDAVVQPLPDLGAGDLCGGGILHQVVDTHRAETTQPGAQILQRDVDVNPQYRLGDRTGSGGYVEQIGRPDVDVLTLIVDLAMH